MRMDEREVINMGVGFVTGRKNFRKVLKTYMYRWRQMKTVIGDRVKLHLFVAYDLEYNNTQVEEYLNIRPDVLKIIDSVHFISRSMIQHEIYLLEQEGVADEKDAAAVFAKGYAGNRNAIVYYALKRKMDYLIFLDDDEYPVAITKTRELLVWSGQAIFSEHLKYLKDADVTTGLHCGYVSPIPHIAFDDTLTESDFRLFIEALSNDILGWNSVKRIMSDGGVTYADPKVFVENRAEEVQETGGAKFISGSNLGINLTRPERVKPFFNPPNARGEDTFLSVCLRGHRVVKVPCYTFHDVFSVYDTLLDGVLPLELERVEADSKKVVQRFYKACVGWVRYKPLYLYITRREEFDGESALIRDKLSASAPKLCRYFDLPDFKNILTEFDKYRRLVPQHYQLFLNNQRVWERVGSYAAQRPY